MAKVYEALRRAEEERQRRTGEAPPTRVASVEWEPVGHSVRPSRKPFWRRWFRSRAREAPETGSDANKRRIALLQPDSYVAEQYRSLRGRIDAIAAQHPLKSLVVTSPLPGEGKTTAATNLAIVTGLSLGRRVLLIDCDLRRPRVHRSLGVRPESGLAEVLNGDSTLEQAVVPVEGVNLDVLAVRTQPPNPSELLGSDAMRRLIEEASARYDRVIVDTPAALGLPDAKAVSGLCDGVVMVVRADVTSRRDIEAALDLLDRRRLLGLVLNGTHTSQGRYGYAS